MKIERDPRIKSEISQTLMERWNPAIRSAGSESSGTIGIHEQIGEDFWESGVTSKRISAALRQIGSGPVTVSINSPGGDYFEGLAIYNLLREHPGEVTVKVVGLAASAASIIAMAGDRVEVARSGFLMLHNTWVAAVGNRHDLLEIAANLESFDAVAADLYSFRSGMTAQEVAELMDQESFLSGSAAVEAGLADALLGDDQITEQEVTQTAAAHQMDRALARAGLSRRERRQLIQNFKSSTPGAAGPGMPGATGADKPGAIRLQAEPLILISPFER